MKHLIPLLALASVSVAPAAAQTASPADSALVGRILLAEDRRDSTDVSLAEGLRHADGRIVLLARRAAGRIRDPEFRARDSLPPLPASPVWPEPAWRLRYRALAGRTGDCALLRAALGDSAWPVRLRAADLVQPACSQDTALTHILRRWVDELPARAGRRVRGGVSWHAAARGFQALARVEPAAVRARIARLARHRQWQVRVAAARAAAVAADTGTLRALARDRDDNVKEAAVEGLARHIGHAGDAIYLSVLRARGAQAVRAAAIALKGSPRADVPGAAMAVLDRWAARRREPERDVRVALLEAAGRSAAEDREPARPRELPRDAVALALGAERRLRVTLTPASGGGSFVVRLRGDNAPMMAARVLALARRGYYDGSSWHRVDPDFVIQGGGHGASEYVGYHSYFRDELGNLSHRRGTLGMSTRGHDTGDGQWFVNLKDNARLDRSFTVFAEVVDGIDVVDDVREGDVIASIRPVR